LVYTSGMDGNFAIPNPCQKKWSDLEGEGRARFCSTCNTHVHAIADYSPEEWNRLWQESGGHVCGFLCGESTTAPRSRRAILVGALLTAVSPLWAQTGRIRIRAVDMTGAVVPHATVSLLGAEDRPIRSATADERGESVRTDLPFGDSRISVTARGFTLFRQTITIRNSEEQVIEARLRVPEFTGEVVIIEQSSPSEYIQHSQTLDGIPAPVSVPASPQAKPAKRKWWQIFH
jgi:hypothetical protein